MYMYASQSFNSYKMMCDKAGVTMVLYADGCPHPGKIEADKIRKEERDEKHSQFGELQKPKKW